MQYLHTLKYRRGFSFIELIVGVTVFSIITFAVYTSYTSILQVVSTSRAKLDAVDLVDEQLEIIRNMPYSEVGIVSGIPAGVLTHVQTLTRDSNIFTVTEYVRNVDDPYDGTLGGTPNDTSPADHKLVEIDIGCVACQHFVPIAVTTTVSPKGLETASTNGALIIKVFDANGNPIKDAAVHVVNNLASPAIVIDDVTDATGLLEIVDAPPGVNAYQITVTKAGYSTDGTTAAIGGHAPTKPNATVALQQVTAVSFAIDKLSSFSVTSETATCTPVPNFDFTLQGSKVTDNAPTYKYSQNKVTDGGGTLTIANLEWDSYAFTGIDSAYDIVGSNPLSPVNLPPNNVQSMQLIVAPKNPRTVLVTVRDNATGQPISGASVTMSGSGYASTTYVTGQGILTQTDWSGGAGQATSTDLTKYFATDGDIDTGTPAGDMKLVKLFGAYLPSGTLTSSSFDTGSPSNFQTITWLPGSQPPATGASSVSFQIATNNDGGTWNFVGPDGTASTYFTSANQNINASSNGSRYFRYKLFESTASTTFTPDVSDVSFTFTSSCTPPGQVSFSGLLGGTYLMHVSKAGYVSQDISVSAGSLWQEQPVLLIAN